MRAYRASEIPEPNGCLRPLVAQYLGYESTPQTKADQDRLDYYSRLEKVVVDRLKKEEIYIEHNDEDPCYICYRNFNEECFGFHTKLLTELVNIRGHLDGILKFTGSVHHNENPVEIKNLGRFVFDKWKKNKFAVYPSYAVQECIYLESMQKPGLYIVNNRDTGEMLKYSIPYNGEFLTVEGFEKLELPFTITEVIETVHTIDIYVESNQLPDGQFNSDSEQCRWCRWKFMCIKAEPESELIEITEPNLLECASLYKEGHAMVKQGEKMKITATDGLLNHSKATGISKYHAGGVSISYRGTKTREYIDDKTLRAKASPELLAEVIKQSKPYDDYSIRVLKEE